MCTADLFSLEIQIKNELNGKLAEVVTSRKLTTMNEIKYLFESNFGDSRDLSCLLNV